MKKIIFANLLILFFISGHLLPAQQNKVKSIAVGKWKFEAPYAPYGFTTGRVDINFAEDKYTVSISFNGSEYAYHGNNAKVENDTVSFIVLIEGQNIFLTLKPEGEGKMAGKAVYSEGELPLTLIRDEVRK
jgi:hypothetical protein